MPLRVRLVELLTEIRSGGCSNQVSVPATQTKTLVPPTVKPVPLMVTLDDWLATTPGTPQFWLVMLGDPTGLCTVNYTDRPDCPPGVWT